MTNMGVVGVLEGKNGAFNLTRIQLFRIIHLKRRNFGWFTSSDVFNVKKREQINSVWLMIMCEFNDLLRPNLRHSPHISAYL